MTLDVGLACEPRVETGIARLQAVMAFRCGCCMVVDMLSGERVHLAVNCPPHVAACAFADSAE